MSFKEVATGTLGTNWRKVSGTQPDYTGNIKFEGRNLNISVWNKKRNDTGQAFWSFSISEAIADRPESAPKTGTIAKEAGEDKKPAGKFDDLEDDIPF